MHNIQSLTDEAHTQHHFSPGETTDEVHLISKPLTDCIVGFRTVLFKNKKKEKIRENVEE